MKVKFKQLNILDLNNLKVGDKIILKDKKKQDFI